MRRTLPVLPAALPAALLLALLLAACDTVDPESLYDPAAEAPMPDPVIASVTPEGAAYAGVSRVTVRGEGFAADPARMFVYFGPERGVVLAASPTELVVVPPNRPEADLALRVGVLGAAHYSNTVAYDLLPVNERFGRIAGFEEPFALAVEDDGTVLASLFSTNVSAGIVRVEPGGGRPVYTATTFKWDALQPAPSGDALFAARGVRAVFRLPEGGAQETYAVADDRGVRLTALEATPDGTVWAGGAGGTDANLFRIPPGGGTAEPVAFTPSVRDLVLVDGTLYVLADDDGGSALWRLPVAGDGTVGAPERWVDVAAATDGATGLAVAAATSGELFVGTDAAADPLLLVSPGGTAEVLYPGILAGPLADLAWGPGGLLYAVRARTTASPPDLVRIVTLREGVR